MTGEIVDDREFENITKSSIVISEKDHLKAIPVDDFSEHVESMHSQRDQQLEMEYGVSTIAYTMYFCGSFTTLVSHHNGLFKQNINGCSI